MKKPLLILIIVFCSSALAEDIKDIEYQENIDKALADLEQLSAWSNKMTVQKEYDCKKSFGHSGFCSCLASKLSVGINFRQYVMVITEPRENIDLTKLSEDEKAFVSTSYSARDECAKKFSFQ